MTALALQTLLLMLVAYLAGTTIACLVRRSLYRARAVPAERRVDPLPEYSSRGAGGATLARAAAPRAPLAPLSPAAPAPVAAPPAPVAETGAQDLKRIRLIDANTEARLKDLGITRYEQIAAWTRTDVQRIAQALRADKRIARENWIEQAQVLAKGGETHYSARRARGETETASPRAGEGAPPATSAEGSVLPRPMSRAGVAAAVLAPAPVAPAHAPAPVASPPLVSERAAFAASAPAPLPPPAIAVPPRSAPERDNLQRIGGIAAETERALNAQGISRYAQISQWGAADVERFEVLLGSGGRIARENWIEQAHILSRGGDTRFSREFDGRQAFHPTKLADAIRVRKDGGGEPASAPARADLGSLRSVRSQAYRNTPEPGPESARRAASRTPAGPSGSNDLKRIRGIGVLIEKRLNTLGVENYEHIANWTASDIDRISQSLDFKGRIERENWVEQARILSAGGNTEFSRRVDRGEVETSRPKA